MLRRTLILAAALVAAAGVTAAPAVAHPNLLQAAPAPGIAQPAAPHQITLAFSETPVARGSVVKVQGLTVGRLRVEGKSLTAPLIGTIKPGVYTVSWTTLGADGHQTAGRFNFGVAGKNGAPPPGAERLSGAGGTGTGTQSAAAQGAISVVARWLLVLAAALLFGGYLLVRRARDDAALDAWRRAAPLAMILALTAAVESVLAAATAGAGGSFDFGLVFATETGVAGFARFVVLLVLAGAGVAVARGSGGGGWAAARIEAARADGDAAANGAASAPTAPTAGAAARPAPTAATLARRDLIWAAAGGLALVATAFDGHVSTAPHPALAALGQVAHVLAAGTWLGAILSLAVTARWGGSTAVAARRFAPIAVGTLGVAVVTGVIAALREVDTGYFLRWSTYGQAVIVKAVLVAVAAAMGALVYRRARRPEAAGHSRALRVEVSAVVVVAALASLLAAVPQGRGQLLPALRGNLLAGPAFSTILGPDGAPANVTLAPARAGANRFALAATGDARTADVRFACSCAKQSVTAKLTRTGDSWTGDVDLPKDGTWFAYVSVDGKPPASPASLAVGVPKASGAPPVEVLAVADLSAPRCRDYLVGLQLAIGRMNLLGGLDGHHKVALLAKDDQNDPAKAKAAVTGHPIALAGACGPAAGAAVQAASDRGIPSIVGDPAVPTGDVPDAYRAAGDPAADGYAAARYTKQEIVPQGNPGVHTVRLFTDGDANSRLWIAGWRAGIAGTDLRLDVRAATDLERADKQGVRDLIDRRKVLVVGVDGSEDLARAIGRSGKPDNVGYAPTPVIAASRTFSESFVEAAGIPGRLGVIRGMIEVTPDSRDGLAYSGTVPKVLPGTLPSLQGIRGYVTGLALADATKDGTDATDIRKRLRQPAPFTDALASPWRTDAPDRGSQRFTVLGATFLTSTLTPVSQGGQSYTGTYFPDGAWNRLSSDVFGPPLDQPPLSG